MRTLSYYDLLAVATATTEPVKGVPPPAGLD
jgi:hypothetical protein